MSDQATLDSKLSMACAHCRGQILQRAVFCPHCGMRLEPVDCNPVDPADKPAAAARFEPPVRSFEAIDFEGDLDAPAGSPDSLAAVPDGDPYAQSRTAAFSGWRPWTPKGKAALVLAFCVLFFSGLTLLHRYDWPSTPPGPKDGSARSIDRAIAANDPGGSHLNGAARTAADQGFSASAPSVTTPSTANSGSPKAHSSRARAAQHRHFARRRTREYAHRMYWRETSRDTTYLH